MGPCKETGNYPVLAYLFGGVCLSHVPPCLAQSLCLTWVSMGKGGIRARARTGTRGHFERSERGRISPRLMITLAPN